MGNKVGKSRQVVDEKYTRPQGLYQHRDVDHKKLRKLILDSKLAPCFPGDEESALDLEECPICFLYYPSLNRSRCCMKGVCTECFLQMKPPHSTRPTQCPFCKTSNYAVEYRGVRTKEEKGMEQIEEQRVIEAQIRMRQQELRHEEERMQKRHEIGSSSRVITQGEVESHDISTNSFSVPSFRYLEQGDEFVSPQGSCSVPTSRQSSYSRQNSEDNFDVDLEDIMVMEAIWISIQDLGAQRNPACGGIGFSQPSCLNDCYNSRAISPLGASPSCGLACAAAALAERQLMNGDSANAAGSRVPDFEILHQSGNLPAVEGRVAENYPPQSWTGASPDSGVRREGEWATDHGSEMAKAGTSYASSDVTVDAGAASSLAEGFNMAAGHLLPESFEEQMMLAMAVSLAEARARTSTQGLTWL